MQSQSKMKHVLSWNVTAGQADFSCHSYILQKMQQFSIKSGEEGKYKLAGHPLASGVQIQL